jgi:hypothetical protein
MPKRTSPSSPQRPESPEPDWKTATATSESRLVEAFQEDVANLREGGSIRIFGSELHPDFYNHPAIVGAIEDAFEKKDAHIRVISGPLIVSTDGDENAIVRLAREKVIEQFLHRPTRWAMLHFRVVDTPDDYRLHMEAPHPLAAQAHERLVADFSKLDHSAIQALAMREVEFFDNLAAELDAQTNPVLLLTEARTRELKDLVKERDLDWDQLDYHALKALLSIPSSKSS